MRTRVQTTVLTHNHNTIFFLLGPIIIDLFWWHVIPSSVILCLEFRQSCSFMSLFTFCSCLLATFLHTVQPNKTNLWKDQLAPKIGPNKILSHRVRVNLGVMVIKMFSTLPRFTESEPHHRMQSYYHSQDLSFRDGTHPSSGIQSAYCQLHPLSGWVLVFGYVPRHIIIIFNSGT